jgi:hypothetical protein
MFFLMTPDKSAENILSKFLFSVVLRKFCRILAVGVVLLAEPAFGNALGFVKAA